MKRIIVSLCFTISTLMWVGLVAQENDIKVEKSTETSLSVANQDSTKYNKWENPFEQFIGVWSLERTVVDNKGIETKVHPGTFMLVHPDASYTIFVCTDMGAVITSQGNILIKSFDEYIEVISQHVNSSMVGVSNRIEYKLGPDYLLKSFWIATDKYGDDYNREVKETWKRAKMPVGEYESTDAFPI